MASIISEAVRLRVPVLCIFRNSIHRDVVLERLAELLKPLMMDPTDVRFFRAETIEAQARFGLVGVRVHGVATCEQAPAAPAVPKSDGNQKEGASLLHQLGAVPSTIILSIAVPSTPLAASFNQNVAIQSTPSPRFTQLCNGVNTLRLLLFPSQIQ